MWLEIFNEEYNGYYVKYTLEDEIYYFYLTNFIEIWECKLKHKELTDLLKDNNPLLIADDIFFVQNTLQLFFKNISTKNEESNFQIEFRNEKKEVDVHITLCNENIMMKLPLQFIHSNSSIFCKHVTMPMITKLKILQNSEDQLISLILKKDQEIYDYKLEGAKVSIKHLETQPFNIDLHNDTNKSDSFISKETLPTIVKDLRKLYNIPDDDAINTIDKKKCNSPDANPKKFKAMNLTKQKEVKSEPDIKCEPEDLSTNHTAVNNNEIKRKKAGRRELNF